MKRKPITRKLIPSRDFVWTTQDGQDIAIADMKTTHLFYTLRMIVNHRFPDIVTTTQSKRYKLTQPDGYLQSAIVAIREELSRRELSDWMRVQLAAIIIGLSLHENTIPQKNVAGV